MCEIRRAGFGIYYSAQIFELGQSAYLMVDLEEFDGARMTRAKVSLTGVWMYLTEVLG
jgi:hypothetical protein